MHFFVFLISGSIFTLLLAIYKEFFRQDLANPVGDVATLVMFFSALSFLLRNKQGFAAGMTFMIPFLVYFYYLAGFSNSEPASFTVYYTLIWVVAGYSILTLFSPSRDSLLWFYALGMATLCFHGYKADQIMSWLSVDQVYTQNPLIIFSLLVSILFYARVTFDRKLHSILKEKETTEKQLRDLFFMFRQPMAHIKAYRDQAGNITRLEIEKINHAFESSFRISLQEAKSQEVNYLFNFVFRNETNWNDWLIIHPRQQADFYSPTHERWFNLHFMWLRQDTCVCLFYDVSADKKLIAGLENTRARYLALLEAIPDIFFVIDKDGTYQDVVFKGQENFYPETAEVIGNNIFNVGFSDWMAQSIFQCIQKAIDKDTIETIEYTLETKTTSLLFEMRLAKLDDNSVVSIARDITRRKKAEFELEIAKNRAVEADALKSRFLANLSHDIRTPMNIIMGLTKMLAEPTLSDYEREEYILDVQLQGNLLLNMIDNTIHLSKIETNTLEVNFTYTNIHLILREVYNHFYPLIPDNRDLQLKMTREIQLEEVGFETDSLLLREALFRLVDNAIKFTQEGLVRVGYQSKGNTVEFFVEDTGQGIPESEIENIFLRFYVIESDRQAQKSGPGLGLSIAQHFIALLGGELFVHSSPGKGTRFWFRLPLKNPKGFMRAVQ